MNRRLLACLVVITIAVGGASRLFPIGNAIWDKSTGDAAYAIMIFFMAAFVQPRARSTVIGGTAIAICIAIEAFQLTGIPLRLPRALQIVLGTRFAWHDVVCYVVGASLATLIHFVGTRRHARDREARKRSGISPSSRSRRISPR